MITIISYSNININITKLITQFQFHHIYAMYLHICKTNHVSPDETVQYPRNNQKCHSSITPYNSASQIKKRRNLSKLK